MSILFYIVLILACIFSSLFFVNLILFQVAWGLDIIQAIADGFSRLKG